MRKQGGVHPHRLPGGERKVVVLGMQRQVKMLLPGRANCDAGAGRDAGRDVRGRRASRDALELGPGDHDVAVVDRRLVATGGRGVGQQSRCRPELDVGACHGAPWSRTRRRIPAGREIARAGGTRSAFAADTLALCVNMTARTVVVVRVGKWDGRRLRVLIANEFQQMAGRAALMPVNTPTPNFGPTAPPGTGLYATYQLTRLQVFVGAIDDLFRIASVLSAVAAVGALVLLRSGPAPATPGGFGPPKQAPAPPASPNGEATAQRPFVRPANANSTATDPARRPSSRQV